LTPVGFTYRIALLSILLLVSTGNAAAQSGPWRVFLGGDDDTTPREPSGVAVDDQGTVFVVDTAGSRIEKLSSAGRLLATFGHVGTGEDALRRPRGITLDAHGRLLVADTANHRLQRFDAASGEPLGTWGVIGSGPGEFILPTSLAIDSTGNVLVADTGNHRIQKLQPDGQPLAQWGGFHFPHGIAINDQDEVYVTDSDGVRKLSSNGDVLAEWTAPGQFGDPYGVAVAPDGTIYVADTDNGRVVAVAPTGQVLARWGVQGAGVGQLKYPEAITLSADGALFVADRGNDRIQVFRP
jgi:DNA-binding beta-propeller fold protein YncE